MASIVDIPVDIILDNLFPSIQIPDLLCLGSTNRFFATLLADNLFWKRKLKDDFNFTGAGTARTTNWKFIYRGLTNPRLFVWGFVLNVTYHSYLIFGKSL
jgi:SCF-associated factor 1